MTVLVDTNVWLDVITEREPFHSLSLGTLMACINDDVEMKIAATSIKDIFYITARYMGTDKAYEAIDMILTIASIASVDSLVCTHALELERPDLEDGIIAAVALAEQVDRIISRDTEAFNTIPITKNSPEEFLDAQGYADAEL